MLEKIEEAAREKLAAFLPRALSRALESYSQFIERDAPGDSKGFSGHHMACKVAITHIDLLLKLARWANLPEQGSVSALGDLGVMLGKAREESEQYRSEDDEFEE